MATALAVYVTDSDLAGNVADHYGFNVSSTGTGAKMYNVGCFGTTLDRTLSNNTSYTILALLKVVDGNSSNGKVTSGRNAANSIFSDINQTGDIS